MLNHTPNLLFPAQMGKSSAFKPPNVVALECVPNDIGTNDVIYQLGSYGKM